MMNWIREDAVVKLHRPLKDTSNHSGGMKCVCTDPQALARQFNDDEAVWRAFESRRLTRSMLGNPCSISEKYLDHTDWLEAERTRPVRAIGMPFHQPRKSNPFWNHSFSPSATSGLCWMPISP